MSRRTKLWIALGGTLAAAAFGVWWFLLRTEAPDPVSLGDAVGAVTTVSPQPSSTQSPATDGDWTVADGSFAGYRVQEELARIGVTTAAGRSEEIEGRLVVEGGEVTVVAVTVDTTALISDQPRRDQALRDQALETAAFPTATFELADPISLPDEAGAGDAFTIVARGDLTLHGVTRRVDISLDAQLVADVIVVVGSLPIEFADYGIEQPRALLVLSVEDRGVLEFQLFFERT